MKQKNSHTHTWTDFNNFIRRNRKRLLVKQNPVAVWLTGLSSAGKTTIAEALEKEIIKKGYFIKIFDGDIIRTGLNKDLGFSEEHRIENIRRIAEVTSLFLDSGLVVICSFISPTKQMRDMAKNIIGSDRFIEVFVDCPLDVCEKRDVKGLYKKARQGMIKDFTGIGSAYEPPENPDISVRTDLLTIDDTVKHILKNILPSIRFKSKFRKLILKNVK